MRWKVLRVIATGGTTEAGSNNALTIKGADRVLIFVDLHRSMTWTNRR